MRETLGGLGTFSAGEMVPLTPPVFGGGFTPLTESEMLLTTQASVLVRARTETGSRPTGTDPTFTGVPLAIEKTSSRLSAVLTARRRAPSGVVHRGEPPWGVSQLTKLGGA